MPDRPTTEIEITEEMLAAGAEAITLAYVCDTVSDPIDVAADVFRAMTLAARHPKVAPAR